MHKQLPANDARINAANAESETSEASDTALITNTIAALQSARDRHADTTLGETIEHVIELLKQLHISKQSNLTRYRVLINAVPDAVTLHDESGRVLDANSAACVLYGYPLAELKQRRIADLSPDVPTDHMQTIWKTYELGRTITVEASNLHSSGERFPVEVHSNAYVDQGERRIIAVARDISARHTAERDLRASEKRYRMLLQAMDKGVLVHRPDGHLQSANPAACRLLGITEEELLATSFKHTDTWHFVDENNQPFTAEELPALRAIRNHTIIRSSVMGVFLPHLHCYRWFSATAVPQYDEHDGSLLQIITTFSDVTKLKRETGMFQTTQQLANIGCWELDDLRGTLFWTEQMYRIHDLPLSSAVNETRALSFFAPDDRAKFVQALGQARNRGISFELELQLSSTIDRRRWVRITGQPMLRHGRIFGVVGTLQNIDERKAVEATLRRQASIDSLTELPNRNTMLARIDIAVAKAHGDVGPAVLYVDLDRFKVLNDMLGHHAGDRLLAAAAQRLIDSTQGKAEVSRFGNDEFVVLLPQPLDRSAATILANRIIVAFGDPFELDGENFALTCSIGIAQYPDDGTQTEQLVRHADAAMFEAKNRGRSAWHRYTDTDGSGDETERLHVQTALRLALDNREFQLVYQPQVDISDGRVIGAEALLRWHSPQLGIVMPARFIPEAESSGDIVRIGAWAIDEACRQLRQWRDAGVAIPRIAVNVSYRQFLSGSLPATVATALSTYDLPADALELELTERVMIENLADTALTFRRLKKLGIRLMIDDFGEGYSSLNYLRHLPVDGLKISYTFMQGVPEQATDNAICEAIVRIARSLHLQIIAEGVETEAQRQFLLALNAPLAQGFLFAKPLPAAQLPGFIAKAAATIRSDTDVSGKIAD